MKPLLYLLAIIICEGARLPRGVKHHFPHFKAIYHGHGATSYQNVNIQSHGSVPIANNYVEHIDDHHSNHFSHGSLSIPNHYVEHIDDHHLNRLSHGSVSIANNYVEHIHEHHPLEHLTHVSIPIDEHYVEHAQDHHLSDRLHSHGLHQVEIIKVPAEHQSVDHYVLSTLAPHIEKDHQHLELEVPQTAKFYVYKYENDYEYR